MNSSLAIKNLATQCGAVIETLNLSQCRDITDVGIQAIADGCHSLHTLELEGSLGISSSGLGYLFSKISSLKKLDVSRTNIDTKAAKNLRNLEDLDLSSTKCTDESNCH